MQDLYGIMKKMIVKIKLIYLIIAVYTTLCFLFYGNIYLWIFAIINDFSFYMIGKIFSTSKKGGIL